MNKFYRVVFNETLGAWTAVSELAAARGKGSKLVKVAANATLAAGLLIAGPIASAAEQEERSAATPRPPAARAHSGVLAPEQLTANPTDKPVLCEPVLEGEPQACASDSDVLPVWLFGALAGGAALVGLTAGGGHDASDNQSAPTPTPTPVPTPVPAPTPAPDHAPVIIDQATSHAPGEADVDVEGDHSRVIVLDGVYADGGGIALAVDGDEISVINHGVTDVSDAGSIGIDIHGDDAKVETEGKITLADGGSGIVVSGDDATVITRGDATVTGEDSRAVVIDGERAAIHIVGALDVDDHAIYADVSGTEATVFIGDALAPQSSFDINGGGSLLVVEGDRAEIDMRNIVADVNGEGSALVQVAGDDAKLTFTDATIHADAGGIGIAINGDRADIHLDGNIVVDDASTGFALAGNDGKLVVGHADQPADEINILVRGGNAVGVDVSGDGNVIDLKGNITVNKDEQLAGAAARFIETATGLVVSGNNNTVNLDGTLDVIANSEEMDRFAQRGGSGAAEPLAGAIIKGEHNTVRLTGGINFTGELNRLTGAAGSPASPGKQIYGPLLTVDGSSELHIGGKSSVSGQGTFLPTLVEADHGARVIWDAGVLDVDTSQFNSLEMYDLYAGFDPGKALLDITGGASLVISEQATISAAIQSHLIDARGQGSSASNDGTIALTKVADGALGRVTGSHIGSAVSTVGLKASQGAVVTNAGSILLQSHDAATLPGSWQYQAEAFAVNENALIGQIADTGGSAFNNGTIKGSGFRVQGMGAANKGYVENNGLIDLAPESSLAAWGGNAPRTAHGFGIGMYAGSDYDATGSAVNKQGGVITLHNAGAGMAASTVGAVVRNEGTINLLVDDGAAANPGMLVGMSALEGAVAINDYTGKININSAAAGIATPFYTDKNRGSLVFNYGQICIGDTCQDSAIYNPTDTVVSPTYAGDALLSAEGSSLVLARTVVLDGELSNAGALSGASFEIARAGSLLNTETGTIANKVWVDGSATLNNAGTVSGQITNQGRIQNTGLITGDITSPGSVSNSGTLAGAVLLKANAVLTNTGTIKAGGHLEINNNARLVNAADGELQLDNAVTALHINQNGTLYNQGHMTVNQSSYGAAVNIWGGTGDFVNEGTVDMAGSHAGSLVRSQGNSTAADERSMFVNEAAGTVNFVARKNGQIAVNFTHANFAAENAGVINLSGTGAIAMNGSNNAQLVNKGTINLGTEGTAQSGMIALQLDANATTNALIQNDGTINIYAKDSFAFSKLGANGRVVNNGTVNLAGAGAGLIKQGDAVNVEGASGNNGNAIQVNYATYTLPTQPVQQQIVRSSVRGYTVGTNANGSAGTLLVSHADLDDVKVNTGFTAGTAAKQVTLNDVVRGEDIQGAQNIQSDTAVWQAQGSVDANGNVDVAMTKNAYQDVVADASLKQAATALEAGYTNNAVFQSLNLETVAQVTEGIRQLTGARFSQAMEQTKVLSNRFNLLHDNAKVDEASGLSFNMVSKGDAGSKLNGTEYDMAALGTQFNLGEGGKLAVRYGVANLSADNNSGAPGSKGALSGTSQFAGMKYSKPLLNGLELTSDLQMEQHRLESNRALNYGAVRETASADNNQDTYNANLQIGKKLKFQQDRKGHGLSITPSLGMAVRQTRDQAVNETGAGLYNLNVTAGTTSAMDAVAGVKFKYVNASGVNAHFNMLGGPNLYYQGTQRNASLAGAPDAQFGLSETSRRSAFNYNSSLGMDYQGRHHSVSVDGYASSLDSTDDYGVMMKLNKKF